jgi:hypothetical protein
MATNHKREKGSPRTVAPAEGEEITPAICKGISAGVQQKRNCVYFLSDYYTNNA